MRNCLLSAVALIALVTSCNSVDDYHYGYAPAYRTLPDGFARVEIGGTPYWHHGGRFYKHDPESGYLLVKPPRGHEQVVAPATAPGSPAPSGAAIATTEAKPEASRARFREFLSPGGGTLHGRKAPKRIGRSPIRRGRITNE